MQESLDRHIQSVVEGSSQKAREALLALLTTAFNTLDHLDIICPVVRPPCHDYLRFQELRRLHAELSQCLQNGRKKEPSPPPHDAEKQKRSEAGTSDR